VNEPARCTSPDPLALTVHNVALPDLADPVQAARRRTAMGRLQMLLVLALCAAPVVASYFTYFVLRPQARGNYSDLILPTRAMPELTLSTLDDHTLAASSLKGQWLLVMVGPSGCEGDCAARLHMQRQLRTMLGRERERLDKVWLVTDGADLAPALRAAVEGGEAVTVLRAAREEVARWLGPASGQALESHLYLVDPMGEWMMRVPASPDPARVKRDLERVLRATASWDRAGR
jgi:hypothetical protein